MNQTKIIRLEAENVKRVKALTIVPTQNGLTVIGGHNNQGKTSILDSICWTLGGERYRPSNPQRDGSVLPPRIRLELSDGTIVERTGKNSALKVTDPSGKKAGQKLLDSFVEHLALDMPKFMAASSRDKAATLLKVIGVEDQLAEIERRETELYNQRRAVGQIADQKAKYAQGLPVYPDAPSETVSAYALIQRQQEILARNGENQRKRQHAAEIEREFQELCSTIEKMAAQISAAMEKKNRLAEDLETAKKDALDLLDESTEELENNIRNIETINEKVRRNQEKQRAESEAEDCKKRYDELSRQLEAARTMKRDLLQGAKLPLPGLSVENGELTYNGAQWDCMSGSDQLKVSAAIVRALKPQCGFVLLDKLEQMDLDTLREFGEWMEAEGLQGIATRVSTGEECSIVIEDGEVVEPEKTVPVQIEKGGPAKSAFDFAGRGGTAERAEFPAPFSGEWSTVKPVTTNWGDF